MKIKATNKILVSAIALVMALALSVGTTFAWFSMNTTVTATGMQVTAKTDATYLVISSTSTLGTETTLNLSSVTGTLLPVSYTTSVIRNAADDADLVAANKWFTATGTSTTNGAAVTDSKTQLTITEASNKGSVDTKDYYVYDTFYLGLVSGSAAVTQGVQADVKFTAAQTSELNKCLTVKVVYGGGDPSSATTTQTFVYNAATGEVTRHSTALQDVALITTTATAVKVYVYFDGEDTNCTTANAINLDGITIDITFTVNAALNS